MEHISRSLSWRELEIQNPPLRENCTFDLAHPKLPTSAYTRKSAAIDAAYSEYCRRLVFEKPDVESFVQQFPGLESSLRRQIEVHHVLVSELDISADPSPSWPQAGDVFLGFEIVRQIGVGGLSQVFLCRQPEMGKRYVVLKVSISVSLEAQILGRIAHPNIVPIYSVHHDDSNNVAAICMPYLGCSTLLDVIDTAFKGGTTPVSGKALVESIVSQNEVAEDAYSITQETVRLRSSNYEDTVVELTAQIADALQHAHTKGVLHGDLKPSNILLATNKRPMLLDFNLSADVLCQPLISGGTLPYMAPEQIESLVLHSSCDQVTEKSDIFSLGIVLYELLTGKRPFCPTSQHLDSPQLAAHLLDHIHKGAPSLLTLNSKVDRALDELVLSCIAYDPEKRPESMIHVRDRLLGILSVRKRFFRFISAHRKVCFATASLLFGLVLAITLYISNLGPYEERQLLLAKEYYADGDFDSAKVLLNNALQSDPDYLEALYIRGRVRLHQGEYQNAMLDFDQASKLKPEGRFFACIGFSFHRLTDLKRAELWYQKAIQNGFESAELFNNIGVIQSSFGKLDLAENYLKDALRKNPTSSIILLNRAIVELQKAQRESEYNPRQGIQDITRFLKSNPNSPEGHWLAARLFGYSSQHTRSLASAAMQHLIAAGELGWSSNREELRRNPAFKTFVNQLDKVPDFKAESSSHSSSIDRLLDPISENNTAFGRRG